MQKCEHGCNCNRNHSRYASARFFASCHGWPELCAQGCGGGEGHGHARALLAEGIGFAAICSNDAAQYPEDSFENMKRFGCAARGSSRPCGPSRLQARRQRTKFPRSAVRSNGRRHRSISNAGSAVVETKRPAARRGKVKQDKTIKDRKLALIENGKEAFLRMGDEIGGSREA